MKRSIYKLLACLAGMLLSVVLFALPASAAETELGVAGAQLDSNTQKLYLTLREEIGRIASGETESAFLSIEEETLVEWGLKLEWTNEDLGVPEITQTNVSVVFDLFWAQFEDVDQLAVALLHDCPYELYWYDKTEGYYRTPLLMYSGESAQIGGMNFRFIVAKDYRPLDYDAAVPTVDPLKAADAVKTLTAVDAIVALYADLSDYDKLVAYRDEICALVSYDHTAASDSYTGGYGAPWQLISVFDSDPSTNVVCEGYAKAFQLLCERTAFAGNVKCYTVDGTMSSTSSSGRHMWNLVQIDDTCYLVDVTNSDAGMSGAMGGLFLDGYDATITNGYRLQTTSGALLSYAYSQEVRELFSADGSWASFLYLADHDYDPPKLEVLLPENGFVYDGTALTVGSTDGDIRYRLSSAVVGAYDCVVAWYRDGIAMTEAPTNAGTYTLVILATDQNDPTQFLTEEITVVIHQAIPTYTTPNGLNATYGDLRSSIVLPTGFSWSLPDDLARVGDAGTHTVYLNYTPTDTANYKPVTNIPVTLTVAKAAPTYTVPSGLTATYWDRVSQLNLPDGFTAADGETRFSSVGTQIVSLTYTPDDTRNFESVTDIEAEVTVTPRDITGAVITLGEPPVYSGKELTAAIQSVKLDGMTVTYTVTGNRATEAGTYTLTVTGTGNFTGRVTAQWEIKAASANSSASEIGGSNGPTSITVTSDIPWGVVAAIGGGAVVLIAVIVIAVCATRRKR